MVKKMILIMMILTIVTGLFAETEKSALKAMAMSAVLPGAGQMYLGNNIKAGIFMTTDIIVIGSYLRFQQEKNLAIDNYKKYAYVKAGLRQNADEDIYNLAHRYRSSDRYNELYAQNLQNRLILGYITQRQQEEWFDMYKIQDEDSWNWEYESDFIKYRNYRTDKLDYELYASFAVGAMILNRIISMLDATIFTNRLNRDNRLYSMPDFQNNGMTMIYEFKF